MCYMMVITILKIILIFPIVKTDVNDCNITRTLTPKYEYCAVWKNICLFHRHLDPSQIVIELRFENCPINPEVFLDGHYWNSYSDIAAFVFTGQNPVLRNNSFKGLCSAIYITLSYNKIKSIQQEAFKCLEELEMLDLSNNLIENLPDKLFECMNDLRVLRLSHNHLNSLTGATFLGLKSLVYLELNHNKLQSISPSTFYNKTKSIQQEAFKCLEKLEMLDLSNNLIKNLPDKLFECMNNLEVLRLSHNHLNSLTGATFLGLNSLLNLELCHNNLQNISPSTFQKLGVLEILYLNDNSGLVLAENLFKNQLNLSNLYLDNCNISSLPNKIFEETEKIEVLSLHKNQLKSLNASLRQLRRLKYLNISHNLLSSLPGYNAFQNNLELEFVDISYNNLTDIGNIKWRQLKSLKELNAKNNNIKRLIIPEVKNRFNMHLEENKIRFIFINRENLINVHGEENPMLMLFLSGNSLQCDCNNYELFLIMKDRNSIARIDFPDGLNCKYPDKFHNIPLNTLNSSDFECIPCPESCRCEFQVYDYIENKINCSNRHYGEFPLVTSPNASILDISRNSLKSLAGINQSCWENLIELNAEDNEIQSDEFYVPENLAYLGLKGNKMDTLPSSVQRHAKNKNGFKMSLSRNRWPCNCLVLPFKDFILSHASQITDYKEIQCIFPNKSFNRDKLISMQDSDLCPTYFMVYSYVISVLFLIAAIVLTFYYYRHKTHILSFMYTHCNGLYMLFCCDKPNSEEKMFDCFISYSSKDSDVAFSIVDELENKPPAFRFCVHERDWIPGEYITKNIILSIQNSRKTLVILSKEFLKSQWFHMEFQAAFSQTLQDKQDRLIFVLKGELPDESEMEKDLLHVLSTVTYLQWGERWFWEKLRYALHERKAFVGLKRKYCIRGLKCCFRKDGSSRNSDLQLIRVADVDESLVKHEQ